jgi:hypothetical protein
MALVIIISLVLFCRRLWLDRKTQRALTRIEAKVDFALGIRCAGYEGN